MAQQIGMDEDQLLGCLVFVLWLVGMMIAVVISWGEYHSILWATVHGVLGWIWVAYDHFKT